MTPKEMTEIFAAMKLAYPNSKIFSGGISTLKPTIELWTRALADVDYWTGQQALFRMCRECEFPSIAALRKQADSVNEDVRQLIDDAIMQIKSLSLSLASKDDLYKMLPAGSPVRLAIDAMGGIERLFDSGNDIWRWREFEAAYITVIKGFKQLPVYSIGGAVKTKG